MRVSIKYCNCNLFVLNQFINTGRGAILDFYLWGECYCCFSPFIVLGIVIRTFSLYVCINYLIGLLHCFVSILSSVLLLCCFSFIFVIPPIDWNALVYHAFVRTIISCYLLCKIVSSVDKYNWKFDWKAEC